MYTGNDWDRYLADEYQKPYFRAIAEYVTEAYKKEVILPPKADIFRAFKCTDFSKVKCVILAQDPYPRVGDACGLAFSVTKGVRIPRSLNNIFKEIQSDLKIPYPEHGDLAQWAEQGVLLLNSTLTVKEGIPNSHQKLGWSTFTDEAIRILSQEQEHIVFMLWGRYAQEKHSLIDSSKHLILQASHPSPHSADLGFFGCKHFSQANDYLEYLGKKPIDWRIK